MINPDSSNKSSNSSRRSLVERLAALRIPSSPSSKTPKQPESAPESPRYIPRSANTKSKFYNYTKEARNDDKSTSSSSPSIGRRRNLSSISSSATPLPLSNSSPIGIASPKYFPKQKAFDVSSVKSINFENVSPDRKHNVTEAVTNFIDSFSSVNSFLSKLSNSVDAKLHLQGMNDSFVALQLDLKAAVSKISQLESDLSEKSAEIVSLNQNIQDLKIEEKNESNPSDSSELEAQLEIALNQIKEIKAAYEKEKENVDFLQNYMEEVVILKDECEVKVLKLEKQLAGMRSLTELQAENEKLKETISLLETERKSNQSACEKALQVLDSAKEARNEDFEALRTELKQKQAEIEKLRGREKHFKESNEIFQQKLMILTEENRKLRGQRPMNHY